MTPNNRNKRQASLCVHAHLRVLITLMCIIFVCPLVSAIDTNEDVLSDPDVKALYLRATQTWLTKEGMKRGDSLRAIGEKRNDLAILALAAEVKENYMYKNGTTKQYHQASEELQKAMKKAGLIYQYFCAMYSAIIYECNHDNTIKALNIAERMQKEALQYKDKRVMFVSLRSNGIVYNMRGNYQLAIEYFNKAIKYSKENMNGKNLGVIYSDLSSLYYSNNEYEKGAEAATMLIKYSHGDAEHLIDAYSRRCHNLYELKRYDEFFSDYTKLETLLKQYPEFGDYMECIWSKALYLILKDKPAEARKIIYALRTTEDSIDVDLTIAVKNEDYRNAYLLSQKYHEYMQAKQNKLDQNEIVEMSSQLGMAQLKSEAEQLRASHQQMVLVTIIVIILAILAVAVIEAILAYRRKADLQKQKIVEERELIRTHYMEIKDQRDKKTKNTASKEDDETKKRVHLDTNNDEQVLLADVNNIIDKNMTSGDVSVTFLADELATSISTLNRRLKNITGMSATIYIRARKMAKAKQLLATTDKPVTEIETLCGFNTQGYFSRMFKSETGISPSEYRHKMLVLNS